MIALLSSLTQIWGIVAGVIQIFTHDLSYGFTTGLAVIMFHFLITWIANLSIWLHQKTLSSDRLEALASMAQLFGPDAAPKEWKAIVCFWSILFVVAENIYILVRY